MNPRPLPSSQAEKTKDACPQAHGYQFRALGSLVWSLRCHQDDEQRKRLEYQSIVKVGESIGTAIRGQPSLCSDDEGRQRFVCRNAPDEMACFALCRAVRRTARHNQTPHHADENCNGRPPPHSPNWTAPAADTHCRHLPRVLPDSDGGSSAADGV